MSALIRVPVEAVAETSEVDVPEGWVPVFTTFLSSLRGLSHLSRARIVRRTLAFIQYLTNLRLTAADLEVYENWLRECHAHFKQSTYTQSVRPSTERFCRFLDKNGLWCGPIPRHWIERVPSSPFRSGVAHVFQEYVDFKRRMGRRFRFPAGLVAFDEYLRDTTVFTLSEMTCPVLVRNFAARRAHLAPSTKAVQFAEIRAFLRYLGRRWRYDFESLIRELPQVRRTFPEPRIFGVHELKKALEWLRWSLRVPTLDRRAYSTAIHLIYGCGLRRSEALRLKVQDVDLEQRLLHVRRTKFDKERIVPVGARLADYLQAYARERVHAGGQATPEDPFFVRATGEPVRATSLLHCFRRACVETGVWTRGQPRPRLHDLRHTFAVHRLTKWYLEGKDPGRKLVLLSLYMGHVEVDYTQHYLHLSHDLLRVVGRPMERTMGKWIPDEF